MSGETILIVDDTPTNLQVLLDTLDTAGYEVLGATNGRQALERAVLGHPDLIMLDVVMPDMDGLEVCRQLKLQSKLADIPVIFMTALSETCDKVAGFSAGGVDYLTKPLEHEEVLARVRTHLELRRLQRGLADKNGQLGALTGALTGFLETGERSQAVELLPKSSVCRTQRDYALLIRLRTPMKPDAVLRISVCTGATERVLPPIVSSLVRSQGEGAETQLPREELESAFGFSLNLSEMRAIGPGEANLTEAVPAQGLLSPSALAVPTSLDTQGLAVLLIGRGEGDLPDDAEESLQQIARTLAIIDACEVIKRNGVEAEQGRRQAVEEVHYRAKNSPTNIHSIRLWARARGFETCSSNSNFVAQTESTVLIQGETGTGKELVARAIHDRSPRRARALVKVNCAAMPRDLVESELFGHERGAFTGATGQRKGRFELADGGTLLLDEIGDMPLETQAKLLRVLQERQFERVGGSTTLKVNVRVITATHRDLPTLVTEGLFREDLYYRLNVFPIQVPSLRGRAEDIPALVAHFVRRFSSKSDQEPKRVTQADMRQLTEYAWPGNVRELENVIERAVILTRGDTLEIPPGVLGVGHSVPAQGHGHVRHATTASPSSMTADTASDDLSGTLDDVQRSYIVRMLERTAWRIDGPRGAAKILGLKPSTLRHRMSKLGIRKHVVAG